MKGRKGGKERVRERGKGNRKGKKGRGEGKELNCPVFQGDLYFEKAAAPVVLASAPSAAHEETLRGPAPSLGAHPRLFSAAHLEPGAESGLRMALWGNT